MKRQLPPRVCLSFLSLFASGAIYIASPVASATATTTLTTVAKEGTTKSLELPKSDDGLPGAGPIRRYEWFTNLWKQRREAWAPRQDQDKNSLVFFGDSITQGWNDNFHGLFGNNKLVNRGISGDTTRGMLIRLEEDVLSLNPTGIVMLLGTNDLEEKAEPNIIASNVALIVEKVREHDSKVPIVLCLIFPASESKARPADKIKEINRLYQEAFKDNSQVTIVDTWTLFANADGDADPAHFPDLLHPNDAGYEKWAATLKPVLKELKLIKE